MRDVHSAVNDSTIRTHPTIIGSLLNKKTKEPYFVRNIIGNKLIVTAYVKQLTHHCVPLETNAFKITSTLPNTLYYGIYDSDQWFITHIRRCSKTKHAFSMYRSIYATKQISRNMLGDCCTIWQALHRR